MKGSYILCRCYVYKKLYNHFLSIENDLGVNNNYK
jgi:hypothetical protein